MKKARQTKSAKGASGMISYKACKDCCMRQIQRLAEILDTDPNPIMSIVEKEFRKGNISSAPEYAELIFKSFANQTGVLDPYENIKKDSSKEARRLLPEVEKKAGGRLSGLKKFIEMAIVGNMIDYGAFHEVNIEDFISQALRVDYHKNEVDSFLSDLALASKILYVADNAGEIIFDMQLIEELKGMGKNISLAVRGGPIINDVSYADALGMGLNKSVKVISTGTSIPGIVVKRSSKEFVDEFYGSDMVISKGQGNFETLYMEPKKPERLYYMFVVKCPPVAELIGSSVKQKVLMSAS